MTIDLLKQSAIPWSYEYKPPGSDITYDVGYTCPIDTALQMVFFLWFRGFVPHSVVENDSLLLQTMIHIRNQNYDQARINSPTRQTKNWTHHALRLLHHALASL
jgi:hypothetical protein